ncbi:expressed unknown protein [Seminavis robusta]|uniref:G domain-containing protein n=1 Tax=Seminavis robusta TaxID=568900 RepID=A0A9N8H1F0_9STRA|nr:expressed unknown protein [Seminavis robusta]|eukprot:Sro39_g024320.1 n/a (553) ;mRNA; r:138115-140223
MSVGKSTTLNAMFRGTYSPGEHFEKLESTIIDVPFKNFGGKIRDDTDLFVCDVPGLDESSKVEAYVREHWASYDLVISVLDVTVPAEKPENRKLLELIKELSNEKGDIPEKEDIPVKRDIPHFSLLNKVDEPKNRGTQESLAHMFYATRNKDIKEFENCPMDLIDQVGQDPCMGRREWRNQSTEQKYKKVYDHFTIADVTTAEERLKETNFETFLESFKQVVFGVDNQRQLIQTKLEFNLRHLGDESKGLGGLIENHQKLYEQLQALGVPTDSLPDAVWKSYDIGWTSEKEKAVEKLNELIRHQINLVVEKASGQVKKFGGSSSQAAQIAHIDEAPVDFKNMTWLEWDLVLQDLGMALADLKSEFCRELQCIDRLRSSVKDQMFNDPSVHAATAVQVSSKGVLEPIDQTAYDKFSRLPVTTSLEDPQSWAYLVCEYCRFLKECSKCDGPDAPMQDATNMEMVTDNPTLDRSVEDPATLAPSDADCDGERPVSKKQKVAHEEHDNDNISVEGVTTKECVGTTVAPKIDVNASALYDDKARAETSPTSVLDDKT